MGRALRASRDGSAGRLAPPCGSPGRLAPPCLAPYKGLNVHSLTKETEEIKGLIYDLLEKGDVRTETAAAVTSLTSVVAHYRNVASQVGKYHEEPETAPLWA